uniref:Glutaredoxin2_C domain-containing protein n=1 Tax=Rhabditophanes sp. KR3021 TaxID=114890 RepID=A0AC35TSB6_9BILA
MKKPLKTARELLMYESWKAAITHLKKKFSLDNEPLFDIHPDCIHVPFLHISMGIFESSYDGIRNRLYDLDNPRLDGNYVSDEHGEEDDLMDISNVSEDQGE